MKEVTKEEFNKTVLTRDVTLSISGKYPFTTDFKLRNGQVIGREVESYGVLPEDDYTVSKYFIQ